jgi:hypothetical protein
MMTRLVVLFVLALAATPAFAEPDPNPSASERQWMRGQTAASARTEPARRLEPERKPGGGAEEAAAAAKSEQGHAHKDHPADFCGVWSDGAYHCH